ncbi:MAG: HDOD domain-containing protein [Thermodesulfobacteriota bacterium]
MYRLCTEHLEPGMVLAKNLAGTDGSVFLAAGQELTQEIIAALQEMGVAEAFIRLPGGRPDPELLGRVAVRHARRFFLYVDADSPAMQALFAASAERTYEALGKGWLIPCADELMAKNVEHLSDLFHKDAGHPQDIVDHECELASFPDIYFRIKEVLDSPTSSASDVARVVEGDVALTAKLLKLVNSPFYGLSSTVDSVARAISLVGAGELSNLALGITAINFFKDIPPELMDMKTFWRHSLSCGVFARLVAGQVPGLSPDRVFTAGLLHDAGRLIVFKNLPYASVEAMLFARNNMLPLVAAERRVLGYDHAQVAGHLLATWKFPASLTAAIAHHHDPMQSSEPREAAVVQLADNLAHAAAVSAGGAYVLPGQDQAASDLLGIDSGSLGRLMDVHDRSIAELSAVFMS